MVKGDKEPMWGSTTEEDQRGYAATTLPFQSYGALGMARTEFEDDSASSQFFWLLFDSDLTPAGKKPVGWILRLLRIHSRRRRFFERRKGGRHYCKRGNHSR